MRRAALVLLLCACEEDRDTPGGTRPQTDLPRPGRGPCAEGFYDGPVFVDITRLVCDYDAVEWFVETVGWTANGRVFAQDTATGDPLQWSEEHESISFEFDECGGMDRLLTTVGTGATAATWEPNESTAFSCADQVIPAHVSSVVEVDDLDGNPVDCVAWGHDPEALLAGTHARANEPSFDLSGCGIGEPTN